jgi:hypothetical protein
MFSINRHNGVLVASYFDGVSSLNKLFLFTQDITYGISIKWRKGFFQNKGKMKYIDMLDDTSGLPLPSKVIFGCMEST